jgi:virginiamycin B lyase
MWFTARGAIGRIDARGHVRLFRAGLPANSAPYAITAARDGNLWFTDPGSGAIGQVTPAGIITEFDSGLARAQGESPYGITAASDGGVWFLGSDLRHVGRMGTDGHVTFAAIPQRRWIIGSAGTHSITTGPDGRIWFTAGPQVGAIGADGAVAMYPLTGLAPSDHAEALTSRAGRLWVLSAGGGVVRVDTDGEVKVLPARLKYAGNGTITAGPRGRLWVTAPSANQIYDVTSAGKATAHGPGLPSFASASGLGLGGLAVGPGGSLWATEAGTGRIARVITRPVCAVPRLVGRTLTEARDLLRVAGCRPVVSRDTRPGDGPVRVTSQGVRAAKVLRAGATVRVVVGHLRRACRLPDGAQVRARGADAVVAEVGYLPSAPGDPTVTLYGCAFATGRLVRLWHISDGPVNGGFTDHIIVNGTRVAFEQESYLKEYSWVSVRTTDLAGTDRVVDVPVDQRDLNSVTSTFDDLQLGPTSALAWIQTTVSWTREGVTRVQSLHAWTPGGALELDSGGPGDLSGLHVDATTVSWQHTGIPRSASLSPTAP